MAQGDRAMNAVNTEPRFTNEEAAREHLEAIRWPHGAVCPHCGALDRISKLQGESHRAGLYFCGGCRKQFTVTVGTVFERSKIPLHKWLFATHLMCASKKGCSSKQLERMLDVQYKTAWFMSHRIREAMKPNGPGMFGTGGQIVEADETFIGSKRATRGKGKGAHHKLKDVVFSLVERNGGVRSFHVTDVTARTLRPKLREQASRKARLMTDAASHYRTLGKRFASHETVDHGHGEYVRGDAHTNTIEG